MKIIKSLLFVCILVIVVAALSVAALYVFLDPNKLKPALIAEVKNKTGYQLAMDQKLSWTCYPFISIQIPHLSLTAPGKTQSLLEANDVRLSMAFWSLLKSERKWKGDIYVAQLVLNQVVIEKIRAKIAVNEPEKTLILNPITASLYQGALTASLTVTQPDQLYWQGKLALDNVEIKPLLQDMQAQPSKLMLNGKAQADIEIDTHGDSQDVLLKSLNGHGKFAIKDGVLEGIDLRFWLETANAMINKEAALPVNTGQTPYQSFTGTLQIQSGVVKTEDVLLYAPSLTVKGQGDIVLSSNTLNFQLQAKPNLQNANVHWAIPVLLSGDLASPHIRLDLTALQKMIPQEQIDQLKEKAVEKIQKIIPGKTGELLQHLLGK